MAQSIRPRRTGRARAAVSTRAVRALSAARLASPTADPLARFSDALSLLAVAHGSLSAKELSGTGDEEVAIRYALTALKSVYSDLDRASSSSASR